MRLRPLDTSAVAAIRFSPAAIILGRANWTWWRWTGKTIVFVEVKTRQSHAAGHPSDAVDDVKQRRLTRLAVTFLKRYGLVECPARFDVIAITWPAKKWFPKIEHIKNAFEAVGKWEFYS